MSEKTLYMHDLDSSIIPLSLQFRKTTKVLIYSIYERSGYIHFHIIEEHIETTIIIQSWLQLIDSNNALLFGRYKIIEFEVNISSRLLSEDNLKQSPFE